MMKIPPQVEKKVQVTWMMRRLSEVTVSLLDISPSNNEDACKAIAHEAACKSDIQYGNWWDEQIHQGKEGIAQHDKEVNDYANGGKPCKVLDKMALLYLTWKSTGCSNPWTL